MSTNDHTSAEVARLRGLVAVLVILPAVYLLGIGPFYWLREHGYLVRGERIERLLVTAYGPLEQLVQIMPPLKALLRWYIELFVPV